MTDDDLPTADDVRGILKIDIVELLDNQLHDDHQRGCQGRTYTCDCGYDSVGEDLLRAAKTEIERLRAALQRIDGINDNPAIYNPDIEAVLRAALDEQVAQ